VFADKDASHVAGLVPLGLARHIVGYAHSVDNQIIERDAAHPAHRIVAYDKRNFRTVSIVRHIFEKNIADTSARRRTILLNHSNTDVEKTTDADIINTDIVECDVLNKVIVSTHYSKTPLTIELTFLMVEDIDIAIQQTGDSIGSGVKAKLRSTAVQAYINRVCNIGPKSGVFHHNVAAASVKSLSCGIDRVAVVAIAAEHTVVAHIVAGANTFIPSPQP